MRLDELRLTAVGPFTGTVIDVSRGRYGLHVIYGDNEAGKSSTLRALEYLLFGFPAQNNDNFLHEYKQQRVGGVLRDAHGEAFAFTRRKGNKPTLLDAETESPLPEDALERVLGSLDVDGFRARFGLDHPRLVAGGQAIASGVGDIGEMLFSAGGGLEHLHAIREHLKQDAEAVFKSAGKNPKLNEALRRLKEARDTLSELRVPSSVALQRSEVERQRSAMDERLARVSRELSWLKRVRLALPLVTERIGRLADVARHGDVPLIAEDQPAERAKLESQLAFNKQQAEDAERQITTIEKQLAELPDDSVYFEYEQPLTELQPEFGSWKKARHDRVGLVGQFTTAETEARSVLKNLGQSLPLDEAERLRPTTSTQTRIKSLGQNFKSLVDRQQMTADVVRKSERRLADLKKTLAKLPSAVDTKRLDRRVSEARSEGLLENSLAEQHRKRDTLAERLLSAWKRLPIKPKSLTEPNRDGLASFARELEQLALPVAEMLDALEAQHSQMAQRSSRLKDQRAAKQAQQQAAERERAELEAEGPVPSREELAAARETRGRGWRIVRAKLEGEAVTPMEETAFVNRVGQGDRLSEAFEAAMRRADELVDGLHAQAERVAQRDQLARTLSEIAADLQRIDEDEAALNRELADWQTAWASIWSPTEIEAYPRVDAMRSWLTMYRQTLDAIEPWRTAEAEAARLAERIEQHRQSLQRELAALAIDVENDASLASLLETATETSERLKADAQKRSTAEQSLREVETNLVAERAAEESASQALSTWRDDWAEAVRLIGLPEDTLPDQTLAVLDDLKLLFEKLGTAQSLRERIAGIDQDAKEFGDRVRALCEQLLPDAVDLPIEEATRRLGAQFETAKRHRQQRETWTRERAQQQAVLQKARAEQAAAEERLRRMCEAAGVARIEDLPQAEALSQERREARRALEACETALAQHAAGDDLDDFAARAQEEDPDTLLSRVEEQQRALAELASQRDSLQEQLGVLNSRLDGRPDAAEARSQVEQIIAEVRRLALEYTRLRLADGLLNEAIERYRQEHQSPVLDRASALFARLTCGSFSRLDIATSESGGLDLAGIRQGDQRVGIPGLSDGSRDQLYLALRLASLEDYLTSRPPIPLILDDILIQFDDDRSTAALEILGELSERTQILFFTHHRRLVDLAQRSLAKDVVFVHELSPKVLV
jgi:uncharacterized protein YhaN